ncbi:MAG: PHP domain-containing protein [Thermoplasmata archaeon]|nr:MAG: PHP domain-containing protein [Thermoplasmata archaeon]
MKKPIFAVFIICTLLACPIQGGDEIVLDNEEEGPITPLDYYEDYIEIIGDGHMHSSHKGGASNVHEMAQKAQERGLDWIFITDYNTIAAKQDCLDETNYTFICGLGEEVMVLENGNYTNEIIAWGIDLVIHGQVDNNYTVGDVIDRIHEQGGLAYIPHPLAPDDDDNYDYFGVYDDFDAMSIYHGYAGFNDDPFIPQLRMDGNALRKWDEYLTNGYRKTALGESDCKNADNTPDYGSVDYRRGAVGYPRNYIYAREFSVRGIVEAVRHGRIYISDGPTMNFTIDGKIMGDTIYSSAQKTLNISVTGNAIEASDVRIISNGGGVIYSELVSSGPFSISYSYLANTDSYFRAEIRTNNSETFPNPFKGETNISFSNPIFFDLSPYEENPNSPSNLKAWINGIDVVLNWTASVSPDVVHYNIYRSTTENGFDFTYPYALTSKTSWVDKGAGDGDSNNYYYIVRAVDKQLYNDTNLITAGKYVNFLNQGWNMVSTPLILTKTDVKNVLQTVNDTLVNALTYDSSDKTDPWKSTGSGDFIQINNTMGFWLYVITSDYLITAGIIPSVTIIQLYPGWNFVGYPSYMNRSLEIALSGMNWESVQFFDLKDIKGDCWKHNSTSKPAHLNDLDLMTTGNGYWIYTSQGGTWTVFS